MTTASAPGKVILFGEHAVVSGVAALGTAINLRAKVSIEDRPGGIVVDAQSLQLLVEGFAVDPSSEKIHTIGSSKGAILATKYISAVLKEFDACDLRVVVESEIPPSSGLGSSAAVVVATVAALSKHMGLGLSQQEIAERSHRVEKHVQKGLGSPMDTSLATFGGYQLVSKAAEPVDLPSFDLVVGCTSVPHDTRAEVEKVQKLRAMYPGIVNPIFDAIGSLSKKALHCIEDMELFELGTLMNINHGLLEAIGVGTREINELVYAARGAGCALGAKLTGAGGGGCMIAIPAEDDAVRLITAINQVRGKAFSVTTGHEGVRLE